MSLKKFYKNKKVLITGHTGFKGAWLTLVLLNLGAKIIGVSNNIPTKPSFFEITKLKKKILHKIIDIRNRNKLKKIINDHKPDIVFHLAAQSLVKRSYDKPIETWTTNLIGTTNLLDVMRNYKKKCILVLITSDKSYKNVEKKSGYVETDILGGFDPYSASKASAELSIQSYIKSFFSEKKSSLRIGVARAGNVIGGGDWSQDRLIPDCIKSWSKNKKVNIRNFNSTRPWQHVLEAVRGYLFLALELKKRKNLHGQCFNFGPSNRHNHKVKELVKEMKKSWKNIGWKKAKKMSFYKESKLLKINSNKARKLLKWHCILNFRNTARYVSTWYKIYYEKKQNMFQFSNQQIKSYFELERDKI